MEKDCGNGIKEAPTVGHVVVKVLRMDALLSHVVDGLHLVRQLVEQRVGVVRDFSHVLDILVSIVAVVRNLVEKDAGDGDVFRGVATPGRPVGRVLVDIIRGAAAIRRVDIAKQMGVVVGVQLGHTLDVIAVEPHAAFAARPVPRVDDNVEVKLGMGGNDVVEVIPVSCPGRVDVQWQKDIGSLGRSDKRQEILGLHREVKIANVPIGQN